MEAYQQASDDPALDPFSDADVLPDVFAGADVLDPVKFLLSKFQIDRLGEVLFTGSRVGSSLFNVLSNFCTRRILIPVRS